MDHFRTLIARDELLRRIDQMAADVGAAYSEPPVVVGVIEGARRFAGELLQRLPWRVALHEIRAQSYGDGTTSNCDVQVQGGEAIDVEGRSLLLLEDIVDTGRTIARLDEHFRARGARDVQVAALLSKPSRRVVDVAIGFLGFEIPDEFVIGFGMDYAGRYRELDRIAIFEEALEKKA